MGKGGFEKDLPGELASEKRPEGYIGGRSGCMGERISDSEKLKCHGGQSLARTFHLVSSLQPPLTLVQSQQVPLFLILRERECGAVVTGP